MKHQSFQILFQAVSVPYPDSDTLYLEGSSHGLHVHSSALDALLWQFRRLLYVWPESYQPLVRGKKIQPTVMMIVVIPLYKQTDPFRASSSVPNPSG